MATGSGWAPVADLDFADEVLRGGDVDVVAEVDLVVVDAVGGVRVGGRTQAIAALLVFGQFGGGGDVLLGVTGQRELVGEDFVEVGQPGGDR